MCIYVYTWTIAIVHELVYIWKISVVYTCRDLSTLFSYSIPVIG